MERKKKMKLIRYQEQPTILCVVIIKFVQNYCGLNFFLGTEVGFHSLVSRKKITETVLRHEVYKAHHVQLFYCIIMNENIKIRVRMKMLKETYEDLYILVLMKHM